MLQEMERGKGTRTVMGAGPDRELRVVASVKSRLISHDSRSIFNTLTKSISYLL